MVHTSRVITDTLRSPFADENASSVLDQIDDPDERRRIMDAHGGGIGVEDGADGGARFWFELPDCSQQ